MTGLYLSDTNSIIFSKHNTKKVTEINSKGEKVEKTVIDLGQVLDANKEYPILSLLSEFLSSYVDIAKDPFIFDLNFISSVLPTALYLIRSGVNPKEVAWLVNQESIKKYLDAQKINESEPVKVLNNSVENKKLEEDEINFWRSKFNGPLLGLQVRINFKDSNGDTKSKLVTARSLSAKYKTYISNNEENDYTETNAFLLEQQLNYFKNAFSKKEIEL